MKLWQVAYVIAVLLGLLVGVVTSPYLAVVFIWAFIIIGESLHYWAESRGFEEEVEEKVEEAEERAEATP
jgi:biopolymer transport protein ExbB/TolQ